MLRIARIAAGWWAALALAVCAGGGGSGGDAAAPPSRTQQRASIVSALRGDDLFEAAILLGDYLQEHPDDAIMLYNAACVHARLGEVQAAEHRLLDAVKQGFQNFSIMKRDPDLASIRAGAVYRALMAARDAADDIIAERRIDAWQARLGNRFAPPRRDAALRIDVLAALDDASLRPLTRVMHELASHFSANLFEGPLDSRMLIVILDAPSLAAHMPHPNARGRYVHAAGELVTAADARSLSHELTHAFHHADMDRLCQDHAAWVQEGIACLYESFVIDDTGRAAFYANDRHDIAVRMLAEDTLIPWRELFALTPGDFARRSRHTYAQVRTIFEFIAERGRLEDFYARYIWLWDEDPAGAAAIQQTFGAALEAVEAEWRAWLAGREPVFLMGDDDLVTRRRTEAVGADSAGPRGQETENEDESRSLLVAAQSQADHLYQAAHPITLDEYQAKIDDLLEVIALDPSHAAARYDLALAYILAGEHRRAAEQRDALRELDTNLTAMVDVLLEGKATKLRSDQATEGK